jgi:hypothetical protein
MRSLRSSPLREKLLPFGIEPGSAEILEKLEVSVGFQGFPMGLEREFNALLSKGENFHFLGPYEDFGIMECDLEHLRELPLATDAGTICQMRLGGLSHDTAISLDTASWKNSYKPLIFDLSPEKNLKSNDVWQRERQRKGGRIFQSLLCIFVRRYFSRFLAKILSGENEWREFVLGLLNTARFAGTSAHHYSLWHANDPHFLTFKKELSDFGFEASVSDKGPNGRELKFRYRAADART